MLESVSMVYGSGYAGWQVGVDGLYRRVGGVTPDDAVRMHLPEAPARLTNATRVLTKSWRVLSGSGRAEPEKGSGTLPDGSWYRRSWCAHPGCEGEVTLQLVPAGAARNSMWATWTYVHGEVPVVCWPWWVELDNDSPTYGQRVAMLLHQVTVARDQYHGWAGLTVAPREQPLEDAFSKHEDELLAEVQVRLRAQVDAQVDALQEQKWQGLMELQFKGVQG